MSTIRPAKRLYPKLQHHSSRTAGRASTRSEKRWHPLEAQMSRLLSLKRECEAILSPFRRLPPRRCSWRFYIVAGQRMSDIRTQDVICIDLVSTFSPIERGPWYLGHVCRSWRDTVENLCPDLWSNMTIEVPPRTGPPFHRAMKRNMVALLERVLERTRGHQLDFYFKTLQLRVTPG